MQGLNVLSAGTVTGDNVVNSNGDDLGKVEEVMLDTDHGRIAYAVLSFGGFLGIGDKYFAIPWESLQLDKENHRFVLDVDKEKLENAPGFDKNNWPGTPDNEFVGRVYDYYGKNRYWEKIK